MGSCLLYFSVLSNTTAHFVTVVANRISKTFNRSYSTWAAGLSTLKAFDKVWYAGLLPKLKYHGVLGQTFRLVSSYLSIKKLQVVLY